MNGSETYNEYCVQTKHTKLLSKSLDVITLKAMGMF